jgi:isopentenyl-diphosphate Delta-isomerase
VDERNPTSRGSVVSSPPGRDLDDAEGSRDRKAEHIRLALDRGTQLGGSYFEEYAFEHMALPELDLATVDAATSFLGKRLRAPLLISCMTGGTEIATRINRNLATAAELSGVALGLGSQRKALEDPARAPSFQVRPFAPTIPLLANLGAVQLNYGYGVKECRAAVDMIGADALVLHLNALQEAIQPEGQCNFAGLIPKIDEVVRGLSVPVIAKEIGCGLSSDVARLLVAQGVRILDTAGVGGTSWARIEARRASEADLGEIFAGWGIPTPESIQALHTVPGITVIGSGGIRSGLDAAKALALGADLVGLAQPFLEAAVESPEAVVARIDRIVRELKIAMFCVGARTLAELRKTPIRRRS